VTGSDVLTDEKREELEKIIITYQKLSFPETPAEEIFNKENFEYRFKIFDQVLWQSDHLNIDKLAKTYSMNFKDGVENRYKSIEESHRESAHTWIQSLLDEINSNIVKYSPELSKQAKRIQIMTEQIQAWEQRRIKLGEYTQKLCSMMDWKAV
jgi:histone H3/H4